jgi:uncharacterized membrane protein YeaQ/YmgE (transglycosylase-associated protein family)
MWIMIGTLVSFAVLGLVAGAIARLFVRSPTKLGCLGTIVLGIAGSYLGGTLGALVFHDKFDVRRTPSIIGAIIGTVVLLWIWRTIDHRRRA